MDWDIPGRAGVYACDDGLLGTLCRKKMESQPVKEEKKEAAVKYWEHSLNPIARPDPADLNQDGIVTKTEQNIYDFFTGI